MSQRDAAYWCLNFDAGAAKQANKDEEYIFRQGLRDKQWLMQYQYAHDGHDYQCKQPIRKNWEAAARIRPGAWCAAYLRGSRFYAIGQVGTPRKSPDRQDRVDRTVRTRTHTHLEGVVRYEDANGAFYEDFTDEWPLKGFNPLCSSCQRLCERWQEESGVTLTVEDTLCRQCQKDWDKWRAYNLYPRTCECGAAAERLERLRPYYDNPERLEVWKYPQRIDIDNWEHVVPQGVQVEGLARAEEGGVPPWEIQKAAFEIPQSFFEKIRHRLQQACHA